MTTFFSSKFRFSTFDKCLGLQPETLSESVIESSTSEINQNSESSNITFSSQKKIHASMSAAEDEEFNQIEEPMKIPTKSFFQLFRQSKRKFNNNDHVIALESKRRKRAKTFDF